MDGWMEPSYHIMDGWNHHIMDGWMEPSYHGWMDGTIISYHGWNEL